MLELVFAMPFAMQGGCMLVDEFYFHRKRGLGAWERLGHPLDTLTVLACFFWALTHDYSAWALGMYAALALLSCVFVTKDEFIHARECSAGEHWLHGLLFVLHPVALGAAAAIAWLPELSMLKAAVRVQLLVMIVFFFYQVTYWNFIYDGTRTRES